MVWKNPDKPMQDIATGKMTWMDMMDPDKLIEIILGNPFVRTMIAFFQILSAISGLVFLIEQLKRIRPCMPKLDITIKAPKDTFDEWNNALLETEKEEEIQLTDIKTRRGNRKVGKMKKEKKREEEERPPPYYV